MYGIIGGMQSNQNRLALCVNEKCKRRSVCMRYLLKGDANDTWVDFKAVKFNGKLLCMYFMHVHSTESQDYIKNVYRGGPGGKLTNE